MHTLSFLTVPPVLSVDVSTDFYAHCAARMATVAIA